MKKETYALVKMRGHVAADLDCVDHSVPIEKNTSWQFPLAVTRKTEDREVVDYHRIVVKKELISEERIKKGAYVTIRGSLRNRSYEDINGYKHFRTEILAESISLIIK